MWILSQIKDYIIIIIIINFDHICCTITDGLQFANGCQRCYWPLRSSVLVVRASATRERLRVDRGEQGTVTLSMAQFRRMFNTCKVPGESKDELLDFFMTGG